MQARFYPNQGPDLNLAEIFVAPTGITDFLILWDYSVMASNSYVTVHNDETALWTVVAQDYWTKMFF